ncbi:MAG TPA: hypothetical protein VNS55_02145 [Nocardioides sp.]|nr:hypothetical protein [Nocardioides sp.]
MGAKDSLICYADGDVRDVLAARPAMDRGATSALVRRLFADRSPVEDADGTLAEDSNPGPDRVFAAVWPGATIVCTDQVAQDLPSRIDQRFLAEAAGRTVHVHAMHSVVDWFAYAAWGPDGQLRRALSVGADDLVIEDVGEHLPFEEPFWQGRYPATDDGDYPLPFHPLELSEAVLHHVFGFVLEGYPGMSDASPVDPFDVTLAGFRLGAAKRRWFRRG